MKSQIKAVKKEIDGKNAVEKMYDKVKASIQALIAKENTCSKVRYGRRGFSRDYNDLVAAKAPSSN